MDLTPEHLQQIKAETVQRRDQAIAELNAITGEIRALDALITIAAKQPENPELT